MADPTSVHYVHCAQNRHIPTSSSALDDNNIHCANCGAAITFEPISSRWMAAVEPDPVPPDRTTYHNTLAMLEAEEARRIAAEPVHFGHPIGTGVAACSADLHPSYEQRRYTQQPSDVTCPDCLRVLADSPTPDEQPRVNVDERRWAVEQAVVYLTGQDGPSTRRDVIDIADFFITYINQPATETP